jgi:hypothetical protein
MRQPSLDEHLGTMESEDLARLVDLLTELEQSPGWQAYDKLLSAHIEKASYQWRVRPMKDVQSYAHAAGHINGLEQARSEIIEKVRRKHAEVQAALQHEREEGQG